MRQILIRGSILIIALVAVLAAGAMIIIQRQPLFQDRLTRSLPDDAKLVIKIQRQDLEPFLSVVSRGNPEFAKVSNDISSSWMSIEKDFGSRVDAVAWFTVMRSNKSTPGLIIQTNHAIDAAAQKRLAALQSFVTSWSLGSSVHFVTIAPSLYALIPESISGQSLHATKNIFPHHLSPTAIYLDPRMDKSDVLLKLFSPQNFIAELLKNSRPLEIYFSRHDQVFVVQLVVPRGTGTEVESPVHEFKIPDSYDFYFSGFSNNHIDLPQTDSTILAGVNRVISQISFQYDVPQSELHDLIFKSPTIIGSGDSWVLGGDPNTMKEAGSALAESLVPGLRVTKLPDGSPYRELVKKGIVPVIETIQGRSVQVWQKGSPRQLFLVPLGQQSFLTNDESLALTEISGDGQSQDFASNPFLHQCLDKLTEPTQHVLALFRSSQQLNLQPAMKDFGFYQRNFDNNSDILTLCLD